MNKIVNISVVVVVVSVSLVRDLFYEDFKWLYCTKQKKEEKKVIYYEVVKK